MNFDPAALFLLNMGWENLFEGAVATEPDPLTYRCKGCGQIVERSDREKHYNHHRGILRRQETARQERIKRERIERLRQARLPRAA